MAKSFWAVVLCSALLTAPMVSGLAQARQSDNASYPVPMGTHHPSPLVLANFFRKTPAWALPQNQCGASARDRVTGRHVCCLAAQKVICDPVLGICSCKWDQQCILACQKQGDCRFSPNQDECDYQK